VTRVGYTRRRNRGIRTYSRKGMKHTTQMQQHDGSADDMLDEGPLIRLGEGIVVDWSLEARDAMFDGDENDTMRGRPTYSEIEIMDDPALDAKRKSRLNRKKRGLTLEECLDEFGKEEILSEMDTWYCPRCKEHRRASKKFELWKTPDILVMHLKRFSSNAIRRDKLDVMVDFPIEGLDLTSRVVEKEDGKHEVYDLFAVDDHWGGLGGGHYTAFAKSFIDNEWYEYNGKCLICRI
jgi:ubiquitin carboxyl-terminal hydrolase 4/11/15